MSDQPIYLFVPTFRVEDVLAEIRLCLEKGWTGLGYKTVEFEEAWKLHSGFTRAHFLASATAGLHLAFKLLKEERGWRPGDEVVTTPLTFVATNHAILYEGLQPVFADVDEYLCLDPQSVVERIGARTRAICFVGMGGNPGRYAEIRDLCRARGLALVLDAAHMGGTWFDNGGVPQHAGIDADVAVFSFHAIKNVPTADAGMICCASPQLDEQARKWAWMGINKDAQTISSRSGHSWLYDVEHVGFKYHGNSVMAAMGLVGLRHLEEDNAYRRQLASWYDAHLSGSPAIVPVPMAPGCTPSRHLYQVRVKDREAVIEKLHERGIYPGVHYRDNTLYRMYAQQAGRCPRARQAGDEVLSLPLHMRMGRAEVERVAAALRETVEGDA